MEYGLNSDLFSHNLFYLGLQNGGLLNILVDFESKRFYTNYDN